MRLSSFESATQVLDVVIAALFGRMGSLPDENASISHAMMMYMCIAEAFDFDFSSSCQHDGRRRGAKFLAFLEYINPLIPLFFCLFSEIYGTHSYL